LWIEGKPYARLELGEIAKNTAMNLQDNNKLAEIYIDDLGWTYVSIERYEEAKTMLENGLQCAEKISNNDNKNYWCAKANRHLAGIEIENKDYSAADKLINEAEQFANQIVEQTKKDEMLAGVYYGRSIRYLKDNQNVQNVDKALIYADKSQNLRRGGEKNRLVKIYSLKGSIYEAKNDKIKAEEQYFNGLQIAKELNRTDEIIRNHLGLARIVRSENDKIQHIKNANKLLKNTPVPFIIDEKEMKLIKL
jgi:tetratricopeptide (TPR) repeat protein